jgi:hypothetical protein
MIEISNSVGFEGANHREDVIKIQQALNLFSANVSLVNRPLVVDGFFGPATQAAIGNLQLKYFNWSDFLINRYGLTIQLLNSAYRNQKPNIRKQIFTTDEIRRLTQTNSTSDTVLIGRITDFHGDCFLNGQEIEPGGNYVITGRSLLGTGSNGSMTIVFNDGSVMRLGPGMLVRMTGSSRASVTAGVRSETSLSRGNGSATLNSFAGL